MLHQRLAKYDGYTSHDENCVMSGFVHPGAAHAKQALNSQSGPEDLDLLTRSELVMCIMSYACKKRGTRLYQNFGGYKRL